MTRRRPTRSAHTPPDQREERERDPAGGQDEAEVAGRAQLEHGEGDGDRRDAIAHDRERLAPEEEPERGVLPQGGGQPPL